MTPQYTRSLPIVSICIPVYNGQNFLTTAIESVLQQQYQNFELLIIDNSSTDRTAQIAKKFASQDQRISYLHNPHNIGLVRNWNKAILLARGKYLKLLGHDDLLLPFHLQEMVDVLEKNPDVSLVTSYETLIGDLDHVRKFPEIPLVGKINGREAQRSILMEGNWVGSPSSTLFRRQDLSVGLFRMNYGNWLVDVEMWLRLLSIGNLYVIPKILTSNRVHQNRQTARANQNFCFRMEELRFLNEVKNQPELYGHLTDPEWQTLFKVGLDLLIQEGANKNDWARFARMLRLGFDRGGLIFLERILVFSIQAMLQFNWLKKISNHSFHYLRTNLWFNWFFFYPWQYQAKQQKIDVEWAEIHTHGTVNLPLQALKVPLHTSSGLKVVPLSQTPHYQWAKAWQRNLKLSRGEAQYSKYVQRFFPEIDVQLQKQKIKQLFQHLSKESLSPTSPIVVYFPQYPSWWKQEYIIYDGLHRAAFLLASDQKQIRSAILAASISASRLLDI